jgi:ubiquinone/menaquinone biosynthesis C-methylase UbiE
VREYYDRRAPEYDDWYLGSGLFAERDRLGWDEELASLRAAIAALPSARVLDVACGTGFLTCELRGEVTALDQSAAMLEQARERVPDAQLVRGEALSLPFGQGEFDRVFTGHFYGHLSGEERERFVSEARRVAGELVVVDSARHDGVPEEDWPERVLSDGSRHRVYKRWFTGAGLASELGAGEILHDGRWFVMVRSGSE